MFSKFFSFPVSTISVYIKKLFTATCSLGDVKKDIVVDILKIIRKIYPVSALT
jgi:hypothetical protein